jgi:hypothetical protein
MKYRTIGTDPRPRHEVSVLSLGTMHFGTATDEATSFSVLDRYGPGPQQPARRVARPVPLAAASGTGRGRRALARWRQVWRGAHGCSANSRLWCPDWP